MLHGHHRITSLRHALSGLSKKRYSVMDPSNPTLCVIGVFFVQHYGVIKYFSQESVMALWVLSKKRYGVMKDPLPPPHKGSEIIACQVPLTVIYSKLHIIRVSTDENEENEKICLLKVSA